MNTPSHHHIHHATNAKYLDANYAGVLIIWDRLFGTFVAEDEEKPHYGIVSQLGTFNPFRVAFHEWAGIWRDVTQMADHASFLGNKVNFILDATLGMINIDQNNILKIFSVVTVFLLPPSVIGAIFGMNFTHIPAATQPWGFAAALGLMVLSSVIPWLIFKQRRWL